MVQAQRAELGVAAAHAHLPHRHRAGQLGVGGLAAQLISAIDSSRAALLSTWRPHAGARARPSSRYSRPGPCRAKRGLTSSSCASASCDRRSPGVCGASHGRYLRQAGSGHQTGPDAPAPGPAGAPGAALALRAADSIGGAGWAALQALAGLTHGALGSCDSLRAERGRTLCCRASCGLAMGRQRGSGGAGLWLVAADAASGQSVRCYYRCQHRRGDPPRAATLLLAAG